MGSNNYDEQNFYTNNVAVPEDDLALLSEFKFKVNKKGFRVYDKNQINDLIRKYRENNDQLALTKLYKLHEPLFKSSANKYWYLQGITYESEMNVAFWQAIENYDIDNPYGAQFGTYFRSCVNNKARVAINQEKAKKRKSNYDGISLDEDFSNDIDKATKFGDIIEDYHSAIDFKQIEQKEIYKQAMKRLTPLEQEVFEMYIYGVHLKRIAQDCQIRKGEAKEILQKIRNDKIFINMLKEMYDMDETTFVIIDGTNLACRALLAVDAINDLHTSTGIRTGYIYRFIKMFKKIVNELNPTHIVVCWDVDRNTWRQKAYASYKSNRGEAFTRDKVSFQAIKDILESIGVLNVEYNSYEGDDLCGTFANISTANQTYVVSGDRDIFQLVQPAVNVLYVQKDYTIIDEEYIKKHYKINANQFIFYKTLMGDNSDNIPGITGIADKGAIKLVNKFDTLSNFIKNYNKKEYGLTAKQINNIKQWKEKARLYEKLMTIQCNVPVEYEMDDCKTTINWNNAIELFKKYEFHSFIKEVEKS